MKLLFQHLGTAFPDRLRQMVGSADTTAGSKSPVRYWGIRQIIALFCMMEMLDAIVTHLAVKGGLVWEGNPFIADVVGNVEFIFLKAAGVFLSGLILMILYKHFPRMSLVAAITIAAFYVFVLSWNSGMLLYIFLHI